MILLKLVAAWAAIGVIALVCAGALALIDKRSER